jgi:phosphopantothenoylcysteine synthetase/decarboxylase
LGVTGSVAAVKSPEIAVRLVREHHDVCVLLTAGGLNFWNKAQEYNPTYWQEMNKKMTGKEEMTVENVGNEGRIFLYTADEEWKEWNRLGDPVLHIELRDWATVCVVAPLSAHTLAKIAHGLCDDTLSCVLRAWDYGHGERLGKPLILAPAMNTAMWQHPLTRSQLAAIQSFWADPQTNGIQIIEPQVKTLACGEVGTGALASVNDIVEVVSKCSCQPEQVT